MKHDFSGQISTKKKQKKKKKSNVKHENLSSQSRVIPCGQEQTYMMQLVVIICNFAEVPVNQNPKLKLHHTTGQKNLTRIYVLNRISWIHIQEISMSNCTVDSSDTFMNGGYHNSVESNSAFML